VKGLEEKRGGRKEGR
jgi:hypothetical protein